MNLKKLQTKKNLSIKSLNASNIAWLLFEATGKIGYYLMHQELQGNLKSQEKTIKEGFTK